jgi:hypothetical protein
MKNRESYSPDSNRQRNLEMRNKKTKVINRMRMVKVSLNSWDIDDEQELVHLESLLDQIEPILDTPFKS